MKITVKFVLMMQVLVQQRPPAEGQIARGAAEKLYGAVRCCAPSFQALPMPDPLWDFPVDTLALSFKKSAIKSSSQSP